MKPREVVLAALNHEDCGEVPYTLPIEPDVIKRLDAHYGTTEWHKKLTNYMLGVASLDTDFKEAVSDTHVRDAYGGIWRQDMRPWHLETVPLKEPTLDGYDFPKAEFFYRPEWIESNKKRIAEDNGERLVVGNLGWGLFERSWNLRGFENVLMDYVAEQDFVGEVLDKLCDLYLLFIKHTTENFKIDAIHFGDDWGDQRGVIMGPEIWRKLIKPRQAKIYAACKAAGVYSLQHTCGSVTDIIPDLIEIGLDCLESCQPEAAGMDSFELKKKFGDKLTFWGCLGSQSIIPYGTPAELTAHIDLLRREMGKGGGFIMMPAKPLMPETPTENAVAIVEAFAAGPYAN